MMNVRSTLAAVLALGLLPGATTISKHDPDNLTVHEWGTFTSIAGEDGQAVKWRPDVAPPDLPCFVDRLAAEIKFDLGATVRMETPVVYFYAAQDMTVDVGVRFREGLVTEWFPRAAVTPARAGAAVLRAPRVESSIVWKAVKVSPRADWQFPTEPGPSHYYAARATDAAPIEVGGQREKFLFYRGVGRFAPPIAARVDSAGRVRVSSPGGHALGQLVLFENRGGTVRFAARHSAASAITLDPPAAGGGLASLRRKLESILVSEGLYPKEAAAMVETWRDSWFEEGARLFYIAPKAAIEEVLPLDIAPAPTAVARVFVGRMELVTPRTLADVRRALDTKDRATLQRYGRFLEPISGRVVAAAAPEDREDVREKVRRAYTSFYTGLPSRTACR